MELAEGETLAERIAKGPLPVDDALAIARPDRRGSRGRARAGASSTATSSPPT